MSSIKNENPSIKYEGIKCLIACNKGINVVVDSSIQKSADMKTHTIENTKRVDPVVHFAKKVLNFSNK